MATERRLIDANEISYHKSGFPKGDGYDSGLDWAFREDIDKLPTVDAVEVVHGRWIEKEHYFQNYYDYTDYKCSVCGLTQDNLGGANYCPNCGAKMDCDGNDS